MRIITVPTGTNSAVQFGPAEVLSSVCTSVSIVKTFACMHVGQVLGRLLAYVTGLSGAGRVATAAAADAGMTTTQKTLNGTRSSTRHQ